jgi:hypothetical protein
MAPSNGCDSTKAMTVGGKYCGLDRVMNIKRAAMASEGVGLPILSEDNYCKSQR